MGDKSGIQWTQSDDGTPGATWNPVLGCEKVSDGCKNCYAIRVAAQMQPGQRMANASYTGLVKTFPDGSHNWTGEVRTLPDRLSQPSRWARPRRIFVNSMSDLFHPDVSYDFILQVMVEMASNLRHTFLILTKRPERMADVLNDSRMRTRVLNRAADRLAMEYQDHPAWDTSEVPIPTWPLPNVWLGTSVEDQRVVSRISHLVLAPAAVRFLSIEPLLGPVDLSPWIFEQVDPTQASSEAILSGANEIVRRRPQIDWVIVGGESGGEPERALVQRCSLCSPRTRGECIAARQWYQDGLCRGWAPKLAALRWVHGLLEDCRLAGVPMFWKQWGGPTPHSGGHLIDGESYQQFPMPDRTPAVGVPSH